MTTASTSSSTRASTVPTITERNMLRLSRSFGAVELDEDDRRLLEWLAGWDESTVDRLASLLDRLADESHASGRESRETSR